MFTPAIPLIEVAARTLLIYVAVLGGLRVAGKREIGQMTPFDLVVILLVANAVQNAMVGPDTSVSGGLVSAAVLVSANYGLSALRDRIPWLREALEGSPTLLVHDGEILDANLAREHVDVDEVLMALREHGLEDVRQVRLAVLETDGSISVVSAAGPEPERTKRRVRRRTRR